MGGIEHLPLTPLRGFHLTIRGRLFVAFAAVASLTLMASFVALLSYRYTAQSFEHIEHDGIPAITDALVLAQQAAAVSAIAAALPDATDRATLETSFASLVAKRRAMARTLDQLTQVSIDPRHIAALRRITAELSVNTIKLADSVDTRLSVSAERRHLMQAAVAEHRRLTEKLAPLFNTAEFKLLMGLQTLGSGGDNDAASHARAELGTSTAPTLLALAELRAETNLDIGLIGEVALAPREALLMPLLDRFTAGSSRAVKEAAILGNDQPMRDLRATLDALLALGNGPHGIFAVKQRELEAVSESWRLVGVNQAVAARLAAEVKETVTSARATSASTMAAARATVRKSAALLIGLGVVNLGIAVAIGFFFVDRLIIQRLERLNAAMLNLANGALDAEIPHEGSDEISRMATAVEVFKGNALHRLALEAEKAKERARKEERQRSIEYHIAAFDKSGNELAKALAAASIEMDATARAMSSSAQDTAQEATAVNMAADQAAVCAQSAARAAEEMSICIRDISHRMSDSSKIAGRAVKEVKSADATMQSLAGAADRIGQVVDLIREVANQTNLLALNATIEAVRVGSAGKGFAVVAAEVKNLAALTGRATEDIAGQIEAVQNAAQAAVAAIGRIGETIVDMNEIAAAVASAMSQQATATNEIAEAVQISAATTQQVNNSIQTVEAAAACTGGAAAQVLSAATDLGFHAEALRSEISHFLGLIRAA